MLILCLFQSYSLLATVDYLSVNHITKELYWGDDGDRVTGVIGWVTIPEGVFEESERKYTEMGYSFTEFPFKIELFSIVLIGLLLMIYLIKK